MGGKYREIPLDRVRELYSADFEAGTLTARVRINQKTRAGAVVQATPDQRSQYKRVTVDGVRFYLHRILWSLRYGRDPGQNMVIDHMNGNTRDNTIANLRLASKSQNSMNRKTWAKSGLRGVYRRARAGGAFAYEVSIHRSETVDGVRISKTHSFGTFSCPREAKKAYLEAVDRFGDLEYLRDGQKGDGVEAVLLEEYTSEGA